MQDWRLTIALAWAVSLGFMQALARAQTSTPPETRCGFALAEPAPASSQRPTLVSGNPISPEPKFLPMTWGGVGLGAADRGFQLALNRVGCGIGLAQRGAYFAARAELKAALVEWAEALDAREQSSRYTRALNEGFIALDEIDDLAYPAAAPDEPDYIKIIVHHRTPVLKGDASQSVIGRREAQQRYCSYAEKQMTMVFSGQAGIAEGLRALARIHEILTQERPSLIKLTDLKAMTFYAVALSADPGSSRIANDFSVLLARSGELQQARSVLEYSLANRRHPTNLHNLAIVYQQLGFVEKAALTQQESDRIQPKAAAEPARELIKWVDPLTMARISDEQRLAGNIWSPYAQGDYVGQARAAHVANYRLRVDDQLEFVFRQVRSVQPKPYRLTVGDEIRVQSLSKPAEVTSDRLIIQPDGTVSLGLLGQVPVAGSTVDDVRARLDQAYKKYFESPAITVTPVKVNTRVQDFLDSVQRWGTGGGQVRAATVMPDGGIALPEIGVVPAQGLTVAQLDVELNERYRSVLDGIGVTPTLMQRAGLYVYVLGEVHQPGRFQLVAPTTVSQAIALAGSWNNGAYLRNIIVLRRGESWQLMGCKINVNDILRGYTVCPRNDIWVADSDVIILPKDNLLRTDDFINLLFTRGIYSVFPATFTFN